jgi:hypothetical protein
VVEVKHGLQALHVFFFSFGGVSTPGQQLSPHNSFYFFDFHSAEKF